MSLVFCIFSLLYISMRRLIYRYNINPRKEIREPLKTNLRLETENVIVDYIEEHIGGVILFLLL